MDRLVGGAEGVGKLTKALTATALVAGPLEVLGYVVNDVSIEATNGLGWKREELTVEIPEGTTDVLPWITKFQVGYGQIVSQDPRRLKLDDQNFGFLGHLLEVVEVRRMTATIAVEVLLRDNNADNAWAAAVEVTALCLGPRDRATTSVKPGKFAAA